MAPEEEGTQGVGVLAQAEPVVVERELATEEEESEVGIPEVVLEEKVVVVAMAQEREKGALVGGVSGAKVVVQVEAVEGVGETALAA